MRTENKSVLFKTVSPIAYLKALHIGYQISKWNCCKKKKIWKNRPSLAKTQNKCLTVIESKVPLQK